ncbi:MAG: ATP-binding protein, partial [Prolixibacteraceae bacterium]|nr:ATP-binding protein [Prolixibacteraceae bacterium]
MYLPVEKCFELDKIVKSFEVAYRGFISTQLITKYDSINKFSIAINHLDSSLRQSPILGTKKFKQKIIKIRREVGTYYKKIQDSYSNLNNKDYDNQVPFVSELIDFVVLFFDGCFNDLSKGFSSIEDFNSNNVTYSHIRNWLSHPASSKITADDAKHALIFIKKISQNISQKYFWYVSKRQIYDWCEELLDKLEETGIKYHNLSTISFTHQKLIERETELDDLRALLFGKDIGYRKSGSVAIYGYGGIGKTAFILEFLYRTIKEINDKQFKDKIDFLLFFTAKEELLSFNETTKKLYIRDINKQILNFDDFIEKLKELLEIENLDDLKKHSGILVIDNFETITEEDKPRFFDFIKKVPRSIQFILTS